jgi:glutathione S-transferase
VVEAALDGREFLVGSRLSVADILCGSALFAARRFDLTGAAPAVESYLERLETRPARERAYAAAD